MKRLVLPVLLAGVLAGCSSGPVHLTLGQEEQAVNRLQALVTQYEGKVSTEEANIAARNPTVHGCTTNGDLAKVSGCSLSQPTQHQLSLDKAQELKDAATLRNDQLQLRVAEDQVKKDEG